MSVCGLFLHPPKSFRRGEEVIPMQAVNSMELVEGKGIPNSRFFGKKRQVTAINWETVQKYANELKTPLFPGQIRSNIELEGVDLLAPVIAHFGEENYAEKSTQKLIYAANIRL